jgi:hypothetical protein
MHDVPIGVIDSLLHLAVEATTAIRPAAPVAGQCWIIASGATGVWAGCDGHIAAFTAAGWTEVMSRDGCMAWVKEAGVFAIFQNGSWNADHWPVRALAIGGRPFLGAAITGAVAANGGSVVDVEARVVIATLLSGLRNLGLFT